MGSAHYRNFNFEKGLDCAKEALGIGHSINNTVIIIRALRLFADNYYAKRITSNQPIIFCKNWNTIILAPTKYMTKN
jgi:hypothetical protein